MLASVGMVFALDDAGLLKWLPSIVPSAHRTAIEAPADNPDASAFYLLLKNDAELRGPDVATPPGSSGDIRPAVPEASTSPGGEARDVAAPSQAPAPAPLPTNSPSPDAAPILSSPSPGVAGEGSPESAAPPPRQPEGSIGAEPKAFGVAGPGAPGALTPPSSDDESSRVVEVPTANPAALTNAPLPPIRPASLGKSARHDKRAKAHPPAEAASGPAAAPKDRAGPASDNPFVRLFGGASR